MTFDSGTTVAALQQWSQIAEPLVRQFGLLAVFLMLFAEHLVLLGYAAQANTTLLAYGYFSGFNGQSMLLGILVAVAGALIGSQLSKLLGARRGHAVLARFRVNVPEQLPAALENRATLVGSLYHFSAVLRPSVPVVAGTLGVPFRWAIADGLGAAAWTGSVLLVGRYFGFTVAAGSDSFVLRAVTAVSGLVALSVFIYFVGSYVLAQGRSA